VELEVRAGSAGRVDGDAGVRDVGLDLRTGHREARGFDARTQHLDLALHRRDLAGVMRRRHWLRAMGAAGELDQHALHTELATQRRECLASLALGLDGEVCLEPIHRG
jgi:hypothetical protein